MGWVDKELKRRAAASTRGSALESQAADAPPAATEAGSMAALWDRIEQTNAALPAELALQPEAGAAPAPDGPRFQRWLRAPNGAALGWTGLAIRYIWPERSHHKSHNFWIRWKAGAGYQVIRRVSSAASAPVVAETRFDDAAVERMLRCLVTGTRIKPRAIRKRRFWMF